MTHEEIEEVAKAAYALIGHFEHEHGAEFGILDAMIEMGLSIEAAPHTGLSPTDHFKRRLANAQAVGLLKSKRWSDTVTIELTREDADELARHSQPGETIAEQRMRKAARIALGYE